MQQYSNYDGKKYSDGWDDTYQDGTDRYQDPDRDTTYHVTTLSPSGSTSEGYDCNNGSTEKTTMFNWDATYVSKRQDSSSDSGSYISESPPGSIDLTRKAERTSSKVTFNHSSKIHYKNNLMLGFPTFISLLGTATSINNMAFEYSGSGDDNWGPEALNAAGFTDPVIGTLLCLSTLAFASAFYHYRVFEKERSKFLGTNPSVGGIGQAANRAILPYTVGCGVVAVLSIYAIIAGAMSVHDALPVPSDDMISTHHSGGEVAAYFTVYALVALAAIWRMKQGVVAYQKMNLTFFAKDRDKQQNDTKKVFSPRNSGENS